MKPRTFTSRSRSLNRGLTMIEILIAVSIIAILAVIAVLFLRLQIARSRDARRIADLERIKVAFEEHYNDYDCYPDPAVLNNCYSEDLKPYLSTIPCDPWTKQPYLYVPDELGQCRGYRVLTHLEDPSDPAIAKLDCDGPEACNFGEEYNYGVSSGVPVKGDGSYVPSPSPSASPTPTPSSSPAPPSSPSPSGEPEYYYACDPGGTCNIYHDPDAAGCPVAWLQSDCQNQCGNPANRCVN